MQDDLNAEDIDEDVAFETLPDDGIPRVNVRFPDIDTDENDRGD